MCGVGRELYAVDPLVFGFRRLERLPEDVEDAPPGPLALNGHCEFWSAYGYAECGDGSNISRPFPADAPLE